MSSQDVASFRMVFNALDTDNSGTLDHDEMRLAIQMLNEKRMKRVSNEEIEMVFKVFDVDKSNSIDFEEFSNAMTYLMSCPSPREPGSPRPLPLGKEKADSEGGGKEEEKEEEEEEEEERDVLTTASFHSSSKSLLKESNSANSSPTTRLQRLPSYFRSFGFDNPDADLSLADKLKQLKKGKSENERNKEKMNEWDTLSVRRPSLLKLVTVHDILNKAKKAATTGDYARMTLNEEDVEEIASSKPASPRNMSPRHYSPRHSRSPRPEPINGFLSSQEEGGTRINGFSLPVNHAATIAKLEKLAAEQMDQEKAKKEEAEREAAAEEAKKKEEEEEKKEKAKAERENMHSPESHSDDEDEDDMNEEEEMNEVEPIQRPPIRKLTRRGGVFVGWSSMTNVFPTDPEPPEVKEEEEEKIDEVKEEEEKIDEVKEEAKIPEKAEEEEEEEEERSEEASMEASEEKKDDSLVEKADEEEIREEEEKEEEEEETKDDEALAVEPEEEDEAVVCERETKGGEEATPEEPSSPPAKKEEVVPESPTLHKKHSIYGSTYNRDEHILSMVAIQMMGRRDSDVGFDIFEKTLIDPEKPKSRESYKRKPFKLKARKKEKSRRLSRRDSALVDLHSRGINKRKHDTFRNQASHTLPRRYRRLKEYPTSVRMMEVNEEEKKDLSFHELLERRKNLSPRLRLKQRIQRQNMRVPRKMNATATADVVLDVPMERHLREGKDEVSVIIGTFVEDKSSGGKKARRAIRDCIRVAFADIYSEPAAGGLTSLYHVLNSGFLGTVQRSTWQLVTEEAQRANSAQVSKLSRPKFHSQITEEKPSPALSCRPLWDNLGRESNVVSSSVAMKTKTDRNKLKVEPPPVSARGRRNRGNTPYLRLKVQTSTREPEVKPPVDAKKFVVVSPLALKRNVVRKEEKTKIASSNPKGESGGGGGGPIPIRMPAVEARACHLKFSTSPSSTQSSPLRSFTSTATATDVQGEMEWFPAPQKFFLP